MSVGEPRCVSPGAPGLTHRGSLNSRFRLSSLGVICYKFRGQRRNGHASTPSHLRPNRNRNVMDDHRLSSGASRFAVSKPHRPAPRPEEKPTDFVPLKLMLVPSSMTVELTKPDQLMGRHSSADIRLPLADVSRRHCRFLYADSCWHVHDLDSLNGVFVNNQRVREAVLKDGDRIRVGSFVFQVMLPPSPVVPESRKDTRRDG